MKTTDAAETVAATLARAAKRDVLQRRRCCMAGQPCGHVEQGKYGLETGKWCFLPEPLDMPQQIFPTLQSRRVLTCDECYSLWLHVCTGLPRLREVPIPPVALWLHPGWPQGSSRWVLIIHGESIKKDWHIGIHWKSWYLSTNCLSMRMIGKSLSTGSRKRHPLGGDFDDLGHPATSFTRQILLWLAFGGMINIWSTLKGQLSKLKL